MKTVLIIVVMFFGLMTFFTDNPVFNGSKKGDRIALVSIYPEERAIILSGELCYARLHYRTNNHENTVIIARLYSDKDSYRYSEVYEIKVGESSNEELAFSIPQFSGSVGEKIFAVDFALVEREVDGREVVLSRTRKYEYVLADSLNEEYYEDVDDGDGFIEYALK
ncbi:MAG: hypothetical protein PF637_14320 [Spirochaetes bacterium]|jgi:hypothetical protein|nr:hypothetical protein [Spirochaetota bacterium]